MTTKTPLLFILAVFFSCLCYTSAADQRTSDSEKLLVLTAATEKTDGFSRFRRTAQEFNYTVKVQYKQIPSLNRDSFPLC
ncbi:procollagen-lysine,2-oxoglutarate 5-dioxygenase 3 isoform X1 [Arapaima gigas]